MITIDIIKKGFKISLIDKPRLNIAKISLSLSNFTKAIIKPNIIINGKITLIKFGIKKKEKKIHLQNLFVTCSNMRKVLIFVKATQ